MLQNPIVKGLTGQSLFSVLRVMLLEREKDFIITTLTSIAGIIPAFEPEKLYAVTTKEDRTPVTELDRKIESFIRAQLAKVFPQDAILGEEEGGAILPEGRTWVFDPVDGTRNFSRGIPNIGSGIVLLEDGEPVVSGILLPYEKKIVSAQKGSGSFVQTLGSAQAQKLTIKKPATDLLLINFTRGRHPTEAKFIFEVLEQLLPVTGSIRTFGSSHNEFVYFVLGRTDLLVTCSASPWDELPGELLATQAGAVKKSYPLPGKDLFHQLHIYAHPLALERVQSLIGKAQE